jgi:hypothetical protein
MRATSPLDGSRVIGLKTLLLGLGASMAFHGRSIVCLQRVERDFTEPWPRHHDDVKTKCTCFRLVEAIDFPNEAFRPIPDDRVPKTPCRNDSQAGHIQFVREHEQRQVAPLNPSAIPLHPQELRPPPNPFSASQGSVHSD